MNLLPYPRFLRRAAGYFLLPRTSVLYLEPELPRESVMLPLAERLRKAFNRTGADLELVTGPASHPGLVIHCSRSDTVPGQPEGYILEIGPRRICIKYREPSGLRAATATLCQLLREYGRRLPCLTIRDYPDFARRGVMLDISRGRIPKLETLLTLVEHLADFKINQFQLYTEHTFAYRNYEPVWRDWGAITGGEILSLDAHCRQLGIELVPNQNSFGHLRYWLEYPPLKKLAEVTSPYPGADGTFVRFPSTLAPVHPQTIGFLRELYDELLPHFTSQTFNVGCDETWDLGRGQSRSACRRNGKGRVYLKFLRQIQREVSVRGRKMMFWGDIILHYPELIADLPSDITALNWGYERGHPFERETALFAQSKVPFYVCPGTSTWMSLIGRHDNALANLEEAAAAGRKNGAEGFLNTDWGDGGHPQPLAVSYLPYLAGASLSWCADSFKKRLLLPVLSRDVFEDATGAVAKAALNLGYAHRQFDHLTPNATPFGAVIAAPLPETRELFCRDGLKYYARIAENRIQTAKSEAESGLECLRKGVPKTSQARILQSELDLATRMAIESCRIMLWQQAVSDHKAPTAQRLRKQGLSALAQLKQDFEDYWPLRNKATPAKCAAFLNWRISDYRRGRLAFTPEEAKILPPRRPAAGEVV